MKLYHFAFAFAFLLTKISAQSTSVFDANYFDKDNTAPPLKIGKGFHINDVYKQTRSCFTPETSKQTNLTSQQSGGKKTTIKLYHTTNNEEYNSFKKRGASGKISFLNLFALGGGKLEEYSNKVIREEDRIIFTANVDFGIYSFDNEPQLTEEANGLINQKKLQEFVKFFGTHYISGIRKESTINVILTKVHNSNENYAKDYIDMSISGKNPVGWKGSIQTENTNNVNNILKSSEYSVELEIHGPSIEQGALKGKITNILNGSDAKKADAIATVIEGIMNNISDPNQSIITQYYYSPFSLYGLDGIYWDEKKQMELIKINETIVSVYSSKTRLSEMISESGKKQYLEQLGNDNNNEETTKKFLSAYNQSQPTLTALNVKADSYLKSLEAKYAKCADIYCMNTSACCTNESYLQEIEKYDFPTKINKEQNKIFESVLTVALEINAPECEKKKMGIINIVNYSSNPYSLYQGDNFLRTISGKETVTYTVALGEYKFKAVQDSGYLMYATVNYRTANPITVCEEVTLKIGFED